MKPLDRVLRWLGFTQLIKIPGKSSFNDLTPAEIGLMIDSFLGQGNEFFDPLAFNDFLHAKLKDEALATIQANLVKNSFLPRQGEEWPKINADFLSAISRELKASETRLDEIPPS